MDVLHSLEKIDSLHENNKIICKDGVVLTDSTICFKGKNNILELEEGVQLTNSIITFNCNNSHIYLSRTKYEYCISLYVYNNCNVYFGKDSFFHNKESLMAVVSENTDLFVGDNCFFSYGVVMRTSDAHPIYEIKNGVRINPSKRIILGDHVWIGQETLFLKGAIVGSGSVLGARSIVSNITVPSNSIFAGSPVKRVRSNIFWEGIGTNEWDINVKQQYSVCTDERYIYNDKIDYVNKFISEKLTIHSVQANSDHYRFAICPKSRMFKLGKLCKRIKNILSRLCLCVFFKKAM